ncbi:hypothetical protein [Desulfitobacterium chlororespirans]|uniref:hypothetical protein n=1 Tax=Desulfitobacterium chlororespirans TaxID=51616 RepID=UPI000933EE3D|nr:hypothetical protein [Desulfitobacterium chlororespirans]
MKALKRVCITYHMQTMISKPSDSIREYDTAESCIVIPMVEEIANDILQKQASSLHVPRILLNELASYQGYENGIFVMAEEVKLT